MNLLDRNQKLFTIGTAIEKFVRFLQNIKKPKCIICGNKIKIYWESRYNGLRGGCNVCKTTWPES